MIDKVRIAAALLLAVAVLAGCKQDEAPQDEEIVCKVMTVTSQSVEHEESYAATLTGQQDVEIMPQVQGAIVKQCVKEGQRVRRGQTLFVINRVPYEAELRTAQAGVNMARVQVNTAKLELNSKLQLKQGNVVSDYDVTVARNALATAQAALEQAQAAAMNARNSLSYTNVVAPTDGVVGSIPYRVGAVVGPQMTQPLTTLSDNDRMYVYFSLPESVVRSLMVKYGSSESAIAQMPPVSLRMGDGTLHDEQGRIESFAGLVNQQTGTVAVRAVVGNKHHLLLSGSVGTVEMSASRADAIVIPQTATTELQDKVFAFVYNKGKAERREIKVTVLDKGKTYVVLSGLNPGDKLITEGLGQIQDGMEIKVKE